MTFLKSKNLFWYIINPLLLAILTVTTYLPSLNYAFQFDDEPNLLKFYNIRNLRFHDLLLTTPRWFARWISTWCYYFGKFSPFYFRVTNLTIHVCAGLLVYTFFMVALKQLRKDSFFKRNATSLAICCSLLFLLHPVQTQTISYIIQGEMEGLAGCFMIATLTLYLLWALVKNFWFKLLLCIPLFACAVLACGTKEIIIILPLLVVLTDWFFVAQGNWKDFKKRWWMFTCIAILIFGAYVWYFGKQYFFDALGMKITTTNMPGNCLTETETQKIYPYTFFISQFKVILHYLFIFLWPFGICMEYDWHLETSLANPNALIPFLIVAAILACIVYLFRKNKTNLILFGLIWFFIVNAPRCSIIPSWELLVDYKTYLASVGWLFVISAALLHCYQSLETSIAFLKKQWVKWFIIFIGVGLLMYATVQRNKVWESGYSFWKDVVEKAPGKPRAHNNFGCQLLGKKQYKEAAAYFKRAIKMERGYFDPFNNLGYAYAGQGNYDLAIRAVQDGLRIYPYQPKAYNNMSYYFFMKGDYNMSIRAAQQAIQIDPHYGKAYYNLGRSYLQLNDYENAKKSFENACYNADFDNTPLSFKTLGELCMHLSKYDEALKVYQDLYQLQPSAEALFFLGNAFFMLKNLPKAILAYSTAYSQDTNNDALTHNLVRAYLDDNQPLKALEVIGEQEQKPNHYADLALHKAQALESLGNTQQAISELEEFLKIAQHPQLVAIAQNHLAALKKQPRKLTIKTK